ncbi:hypothetical protein [Rubrivivax rivuli]|uniref:Uncharacterized protein n=1 Tax=Rubrivivax rivuli TaxID=1862385 RepID=A0A437RS20_9BURK|nr:hypothetical protein [Rubrivivax rivuli]RVU49522.1 hypothetical protein EOE66_02845 [Rubrivivax rivuli]
MTIKQSGQGEDAAWEVWVGRSRRRLFVWRKLGGREAAHEAAKQEEQRMRAEQPKPLARASAWLRQAIGPRKGP